MHCTVTDGIPIFLGLQVDLITRSPSGVSGGRKFQWEGFTEGHLTGLGPADYTFGSLLIATFNARKKIPEKSLSGPS